MLELLRYEETNPQRPPHWRWERGRILREHGAKSPFHGQDDRWIAAAARLQSKLHKAGKDDLAKVRIYKHFSYLGVALDIWDAPKSESGFRNELEARLLIGQPLTATASQMNLDPSVVRAYEQVFFNVSDRLEAPSYITHCVLKDRYFGGLEDRDFWILIKGFAYFTRSPELVTAMISSFPDPRGAKVSDIPQFLANDSRWSLARKLALAARMFKLNDFNQERLLDIGARLAVANQESGGVTSEDGFKSNVKALMAGIPWSVRKPLELILGESMTARAPTKREPRASELVIEASGQPLPPDDYENFTYPEPEKKS